MSELFKTAIVEKRNVLNEIKNSSMSLQELRLFSIYLSKIDPYNVNTRIVRFPLEDFRRIVEIGADMSMSHFRNAVKGILQKVVEVPNENGSGYTAFQLFKRARVDKDEYEQWYVELNAHDDALPLMFDFKERYFKYELWNALRLKSVNQVRMYEILKQYEKIGRRELLVTELRELLGVKKDEYSGRTGWSDFKRFVLDSCQQALKESTDICFTYERGKGGRGGRWITVVFRIMKNTEYKDPLSLREFIEKQSALKSPAPEAAFDDDNSILSRGQTRSEAPVLSSDVTASAVKEPEQAEMQSYSAQKIRDTLKEHLNYAWYERYFSDNAFVFRSSSRTAAVSLASVDFIVNTLTKVILQAENADSVRLSAKLKVSSDDLRKRFLDQLDRRHMEYYFENVTKVGPRNINDLFAYTLTSLWQAVDDVRNIEMFERANKESSLLVEKWYELAEGLDPSRPGLDE